jgi:uncharacterized protein YbbC (DUF1343 family)
MVLFEGTNVSEGRGTTRPFEIAGAPWIDGDRLAASMNGAGLPGVHFRPMFFQPTFQKHAGQTCGGCQLHLLDRNAFRPVLTALALLEELRRTAPDRFAWREPPYEYEYEKAPIDILYGSDALRRELEAGVGVREIAAGWEPGMAAFEPIRRRFLMY